MPPKEVFRLFAHKIAAAVGSPLAFVLACLLIILWLVAGPVFQFSDTWQLVINTTTTIITFLIVFLIQNSQNRDSRAVHLKLDELIRGVVGARSELVDLEECTDKELEIMQQEFKDMHDKLTKKIAHRKPKHKN